MGPIQSIEIIYALVTAGHMHTISRHYWIPALSMLQGVISRSRLAGSTTVLGCWQQSAMGESSRCFPWPIV